MSDHELPDHARIRALIADLDEARHESERIRALIDQIRLNSRQYPGLRGVVHPVADRSDPSYGQSS
jgi:hypothetical protein